MIIYYADLFKQVFRAFFFPTSYLQFVCLDVATAIRIVSPPCLKQIERAKGNLGVRPAPMHTAPRQLQIHPQFTFLPGHESSAVETPSRSNCDKSLILFFSRGNTITAGGASGMNNRNRNSFRGIRPSQRRAKQREKGKKKKVILMNVLI